ncbi:hypothetical protein CPER28S_02590 [Cellulomonas persica]|uniref:DUF4352 domain-containing protein n=1 Tax=Cellulomonas persica TaxID=76861 RepID=A0A510UWJ4_9CELL|nr:hypothetical protein CPE01_27960 [Cellulomonas persica]
MGGAGAVVLVVALVVALQGDDESPGADATPTATAGATTSAGAQASAHPSPTGAADPSAEPTPTAAATPGASEPPAGQDVPVPPLGDKDPVVGRGDDVVSTGGIEVAATSLTAVTTDVKGPGDVVGPGIVVTLELRNTTTEPFDATGVAVAAFGGTEGVPLSPVDSDGRNDHLEGEVAAGATASGTYVFMSPDEGDALALQVLLGATFSPVVLQGLEGV